MEKNVSTGYMVLVCCFRNTYRTSRTPLSDFAHKATELISKAFNYLRRLAKSGGPMHDVAKSQEHTSDVHGVNLRTTTFQEKDVKIL
jgi:hypothetical protein